MTLPMHPWALEAALAAHCAYEQNNEAFWKLHDFFFDNQRQLTADNIREKIRDQLGAVVGLDPKRFMACQDSPATKSAIEEEVAFGKAQGVHATPTVFVNDQLVHVSDPAQMVSLIREVPGTSGGSITSGESARERRRTVAPSTIPDPAKGEFPTLGPTNAPNTLVVFSDFECPYCARLAKMIRNDVLLVEGERLRIVFRNFPLPSHLWARGAAEAASCAYEQKNEWFWKFHDFFFDHQHDLNAGNIHQEIMKNAHKLADLNYPKFQACLDDHGAKAILDRDLAYVIAKGIEGTPAVFFNGTRVDIVAPEQLLTLIQESKVGGN